MPSTNWRSNGWSIEDKASNTIDLYPDIETDHTYLDQEEIIASLLEKNGTLTQKNKEKLATPIASSAYNAFAKEYQLSNTLPVSPMAEVTRGNLRRPKE